MRSALMASVKEPLPPAEQSIDPPHGWFVYILWGESPSRPLYVGQSTNVLSRIGSHMGDAEKRRLTKRIDLIRCGSNDEMVAMEKRLILEWSPWLNVLGNEPDAVRKMRKRGRRKMAARMKPAHV